MSSPQSPQRGRGRGSPRGVPRGGRGGGRGRGGGDRGGAPITPLEQPPRNVCRFFWSTGACNRGFDCTFQHTAKVNVPQPSSASSEADGPVDFFSTAGLAANNGSVVDTQNTLRPTEAHNHIKAFLHDNFVFTSATRLEGFARIFASINDRNKAWVWVFYNAFLDMIVHGNALFRIGDALRFTPVRAAIGVSPGNLSFQRGYFPFLEYMSSNLVLKSTMHQNINALYTNINQNFDAISDTLRTCMGTIIDAKSWLDTTPGLSANRQNTLDGVIVFGTLSTLLSQFFSRFKQAIRNHPSLLDLVKDLVRWFDAWSDDVSSSSPQFNDPITSSPSNVRILTLGQLGKEITRLQDIVNREFGVAQELRRPSVRQGLSDAKRHQAFISQRNQVYDPPGELREGNVPRHDNDNSNIALIRVAPTHEELMCSIPPYLPEFIPDTPHHLPSNSMEKHLDIQFRLLREELTSSIRESLTVLHDDLAAIWSQPKPSSRRPVTRLEEVMKKNGGAYRTNSVFFQLYVNARFAPVLAERRTFTVGLTVNSPNGPARDPSAKKRKEYWEHGKRLQHGSLVALVIVSRGSTRIHLGTIMSMGEDIGESARPSPEEIQFRVSFFDAEVALRALRRENISRDASNFALLVDNNIMFDSIRPFLETLQSIEPTSIPFGSTISSGENLQGSVIVPPRYARVPGFKFELGCLAKPGEHIRALNVQSPTDVALARQELRRSSQLDPSQVEAMVATLTRELSLIQGPPGTGKSFTGKEILRVLFASKIRPVVLISFTNHALDHMLSDILDARITTNIIRLGSRSADEHVAEYNLTKLEKIAGNDVERMLGRREYAALKKTEEDIARVMDSIQLPRLSWEKVFEFLNIHYPEQADLFVSPPFWITELATEVVKDEEEHGEWTKVESGKKKQGKDDADLEAGIYGFWKRCRDVEFLIAPPAQPVQVPVPPSNGGSEETSTVFVDPRVLFFMNIGFHSIPPIPSTDRSLDELLEQSNIWNMSPAERHRLAAVWESELRSMAYDSNVAEFEALQRQYQEACANYNNIKDEGRRRLLSKADLIGCTTTGAAKLISLLKTVGPKVLMVEEAGQVLESHIVAALVPSVEHLICIGDPQQLRPTLANFALSMDSERGRKLYKFDRSLMERLANAGWPMSQINVQRRMRPSISHFPRTILYSKLEDHQVVQSYPPVQGMEKDVFFFTHTNPENGEQDSVSKFNKFEVDMIKDLVLYFLKQGVYSGAGDIAVLCAYLGQLQKVRAALRDLKIAVSVDERDEDQLLRQGDEEATNDTFDQVLVAKHIRLGTVDTFQGNEVKIVIVSLVRNSGSFEEGHGSIGFLKSSNRINVALSRAKHGMFILGNASNLRQNPTWKTILDEMETHDQIGYGFPIVCPRHPDRKIVVTKPGQLSTQSPEGGCLLPCDARLPCGHTCPSVCHPDRDNHRRLRCYQPCTRIECPRGHPCPLLCYEDCGQCMFPIYDVTLPCGHVARSISCYALDDLSAVRCTERVEKPLRHCKHTATMACFQDPEKVDCDAICGGTMACCSRSCNSKCSQCQRLSLVPDAPVPSGVIARVHHQPHPCERILKCQHVCGIDCSQNHECNGQCGKQCRQQCVHHKCPKPCWEPCPPCMEPCMWTCPHISCPVLCGSICSRLPCDELCENTLECGHPCPSVCGEPCQDQACPVCLPTDRKEDVVDVILGKTLAEFDPSTTDVGERLITLQCGHIFTVETLDGHCGMSAYYEIGTMGEFLDVKAPPITYQTPPSCPTCRGPINALRYGRVTKRANLDILEQNVASKMSVDLDSVSPEIEVFSSDIEVLTEDVKKIAYTEPKTKVDDFDALCTHRGTQYGTDLEPLPPVTLSQPKMTSLHGFSHEEARKWISSAKNILKVYRKVVTVAITRGSHVKAYEAALSTLYRLELSEIAADPERACDAPEPLAMEAVNKKIGQPPHKADMRFQVEAFFLSIELRFSMAQLAQARISGLSSVSDDPMALHHRRLWETFVQFIHDSCVRDAQKALRIADKSSASRLAARATIHILRADLEKFRYDIILERGQEARQGPLSEERREDFRQRVGNKKAEGTAFCEKAMKAYLRSRPSVTLNEMREERLWFTKNCTGKAKQYLDEYDQLQEHIAAGTAYTPLSFQEKQDIVKAFGFTHRGHFYNCPNGHTFVITECGGAMQASICPECGAAIGGSHHSLNSSNTRAIEFEEISQSQGVHASPWAWARGA
ncbi:hypothetical protein OF83DRAFT_1248643 [Amylostereum chailletii]|nr:hypothetical protein OF83DRAFT_1248643 [Amylostereum chailletii]